MQIRYSRVIKGRRYWHATPALQRLGFRDIACGKEGVRAQARALRLTAKALSALEKAAPEQPTHRYKPGTIGHMINAYERSSVFRMKGAETRDKAHQNHKVITTHLGDTRLDELTEDDVIDFSGSAERENGPYARWHALKALKGLLRRATSRQVIPFNPAEDVVNPQPQGRQQIWTSAEIDKLVEGAREAGFVALSLCIELMDECGFSPVDARGITAGMLFKVGPVCVIDRARAKTGQDGIWAISEGLYERIEAYAGGLGVVFLPDTPIFRRHLVSKREGHPLPWRTKQEFARDFRDVRTRIFGKDEKRRAMDIRRTVSVDTDLAGMSREARARMLANAMDRSEALHKVYTPDTIEAATRALERRIEGREMRTKHGPALKFFSESPSGVEI